MITLTKWRVGVLVFLLAMAGASGWIATGSAQAANDDPLVFDSGVVPLGTNQVLKAIVTNTGDRNARARARFMDYTNDDCVGSVCSLQPSNQSAIGAHAIAPDGALSLVTEVGFPAARMQIQIAGRNPNATVTFLRHTPTTGQTEVIAVSHEFKRGWATFPSS